MKKPTHSRATRFFNRIAVQGWHKSDFFTYTWKYPVLRRWLTAQLLPSDKVVLSIGCGSGEIEMDLRKMGRQVVGLDVSHEMLRAAAQRGLKALVRADARFLPFARGSFDLVTFMESVGYFDLDRVLPGVKRVLSKRGRLLMTAYPPQHDSDSLYKNRSLQRLTSELRDAGFQVVDQQALVVKRGGVITFTSEARPTLLYAMARKKL